MIRADQIDVLVDLSLHSGVNRLLAFARRAAPVQVSYLGYAFTPGLSTIDYRLTDAVLDPADDTSVGPERLWRVPGIFCCYQPPDDAPAIGPAPVQVNGHITLGSFNKLAKITDAMLHLWARLLNEMPSARLLIQAQGADQQSFGSRIEAVFKRDYERVSRRGLQPMGDYLSSVSSVDIALDTFPFSGHTTTCHAMWMGVPTITLAGNLALARVGRSLNLAVDLADLSTSTPERYVEVATQLSGDPVRLMQLRGTLRERMRRSVLMDAIKFTRHVENAYRQMWAAWTQSP
jgi:predicted O-linked N-acetylglucosamine transferase (SPINDLY family)